MELSSKIIEKFYQFTEKTDYCWNWIGTLDHGTPSVCNQSARRISLSIVGKKYPNNKPVLPLVCRNKLCVNPAHLESGVEARFYSYVHKLSEANGGCWVWTGCLNKEMYGYFQFSKTKSVRAHVYSWELHNKHTITKGIGLEVCHKCDKPYCVNPDHLFLGTHKDNMSDMASKGRRKGKACGEKKWPL